MARKLVVLLDGTGNEIGSNLSNVMKTYVCLRKDEEQLVWYDPGVGTIGTPGWWSAVRLKLRNALGLALGLGLDENVLDAYSWLCRTWQPGDRVYLLGFSRGAYTARVLAGFIHMCGLLRPDQLNLCGYALVAYKSAADNGDIESGFNFGRIADTRRITFEFVGVWDTVASLLVPRADRFYLPSLQFLPFTRANPSVKTFRHAIAMDERRRMFRLNHWKDPQPFRPDPRDWNREEPQDVRQVWFAGVHADVGGGYPEPESSLSKFPLLWMIGEARKAGLSFDEAMVDRLARGKPSLKARPTAYDYVAPDPAGPLHRSLSGPWWPLEAIPKYYTLKEWSRRFLLFDFYLPAAEPRPVPNRPDPRMRPPEPFLVHSSALARIATLPGYRPVNLPAHFDVETEEGPPVPPQPDPPPPYRRPGLLARLRSAFGTLAPGWTVGAPALALLGLGLIVLVLYRFDALRFDPLSRALWPSVALCTFGRALLEETAFRAAIVRPPPDGATPFGPIAMSAILFALWHPLYACLFKPVWREQAWEPGFLAACAALGAVCAFLLLKTRSVWPAISFHFALAFAGIALFGGRMYGP